MTYKGFYSWEKSCSWINFFSEPVNSPQRYNKFLIIDFFKVFLTKNAHLKNFQKKTDHYAFFRRPAFKKLTEKHINKSNFDSVSEKCV